MLVGPDLPGIGLDVFRLGGYAVNGERLEAVGVVGERQVADGTRGLCDHLGNGARGVLLLRGEACGNLGVAQDGLLEGRAGTRTGRAVDDGDSEVLAADLLPVGDLAREDLLQVVHGDVVDVDVGVHDRTHADDGDLVVGDLGDVVFVLQLLLGEHVGITDLDRAFGDLRDALARAATLDGNLHAARRAAAVPSSRRP